MRLWSYACSAALAAALAVAIPGSAALAQSDTDAQPRYAPWESGQQDTQALVKELRTLIDEAERSRAANPVLLQDLRNLAAKYAAAAPAPSPAPAIVRLLSDDFADGNYTAGPVWKVSAGQYRIETKGTYTGLRSSIATAPVIAGGDDLAAAILGAVLQPQGQSQASGGGEHASIYTSVKISNAFRLRLELTSKTAAGRLDFGPYQGASGSYAYRLAYFPGATPGLKLLRVSPQGTTVVASYDGPLRLEDRQPHVIDWARDGAGAMTVAVDGTTRISATDAALKDPFDGWLVINSGGDYAIRSIAIDGQPSPP